MTRDAQVNICDRVGAVPDTPLPEQKVGIALATLRLEPLNGLRHPAEGDTCGWYIWGGTELSEATDFFQPLHVAHLNDYCPLAMPYLALRPGWRFLCAPGQEDVSFDPTLIECG